MYASNNQGYYYFWFILFVLFINCIFILKFINLLIDLPIFAARNARDFVHQSSNPIRCDLIRLDVHTQP